MHHEALPVTIVRSSSSTCSGRSMPCRRPSPRCNSRNHYTADFKRATVRRFLASGKPVSTFAGSINIERTVLHRWIAKYGDACASGPRGGASRSGSASEPAVLKRGLASVKRTVGILRDIVRKTLGDRYNLGDIDDAWPGVLDGVEAGTSRPGAWASS